MSLHDLAQKRSEWRFGPHLPERQVSRKSTLLAGAVVLVTVVAISAALPMAWQRLHTAAPTVSRTASVPQYLAPISTELPQRVASIAADGGAVLPGAAVSAVPMLARSGPQALQAPLFEAAPQPSQPALATASLPTLPLGDTRLARVDVLTPTATTPRPDARRLAALPLIHPLPRPGRTAAVALEAPASALPRPTPRPERTAANAVEASASTLLRPLPRPERTAAGAFVVAAARPVPRPEFAQASLVPAAIAEADMAVAGQAEIVLAGYAPMTSPQPAARPARISQLLQRVAATEAPLPVNPVRNVSATEALAPEALASVPASTVCPSQLARAIPRRAQNARNGSEIAAALGTGGGVRDALIARELLAGNMPSFLRALTPVTMAGKTASGREVQITVCVTPDYLALGDDADFVRVPMGLPEAAKIADKLGFMLPTTRMVDAIYAQAGLRLAPRPMQAGPQMSSTGYFRRHNATIDGQTSSASFHRGELIAGTKKDLVLSNRLRSSPGQVAIYGWHQPNGRPIQPLSTVHGAHYSDYSHGVRLVSRTAYLNGKAVALSDLLEDPVYAWLISNEGPIPASRTLLASLYTH